jgi:hypothetical protein
MLFATGYLAPGLLPPGYFPGDGGPVDPGPVTLRQAVRAMLADAPGVSAIVGGRVYNATAARGVVYPRITFTVPGQSGEHLLSGPDGSAVARVRVSCWATDGETAERLSNAVKAALDGFQGYVGSVYVENCGWAFEADQTEPAGDGASGTIHQTLVDFYIDHRAPTGV